jgi:hypothetical protein
MTDLPVMPRYLIPVFSWPVVTAGLLIGSRMGVRLIPVAIVVSLLAVASLGADAYDLTRQNGVAGRLYPDDIACIDDALERQSLQNGIAQYWDAKYIQTFSRLDLTMAQYLENLEPMKWITSGRYFRNSYDFAVVSEDAEPAYKISSDLLQRVSGPPARVVSCGNRTLYIYGKDRLRVASGSN